MNLRSIRILLLFSMAVLCNVLLLGHIAERVLQINCFSYETAWRNLRDHQIPFEKEYAASDANIHITSADLGEQEAQILSFSSMSKVLFYLRQVPNGVQHMSRVMPGLVETSLNMGILTLKEDGLFTTTSLRSSVSTRKEELFDRLAHLVEFLGGEVEANGDYPAWEYRTDSKLRETISEVYRELFEKEPVFEAIHAGLECGILSGKISDLDCVSFGPDNYDIHTPNERLSISSTERVWILLKEFLKRCR